MLLSTSLFELPARKVPADFVTPAHRAMLAGIFAACHLRYLKHYYNYFRAEKPSKRDDELAALLCVELIEAELQSRGEVVNG